MNPAFILLVILGVIFLWLLLSFMYVPIGQFFNQLFKDSHDAMQEGGEIDFYKNKEEEKKDGK